jgi:hypothetical protein
MFKNGLKGTKEGEWVLLKVQFSAGINCNIIRLRSRFISLSGIAKKSALMKLHL